MSNDLRSRRDFLRETALATAGLAASVPALQAAEAAKQPLNFNRKMEYRRLGKTGVMVSAVCLGGHWKRLDATIPGLFKKGGGWMEVNDSCKADFDKNRYEVVSRCIEAGINYVDACAGHEIMAYSRALKGRRDKMLFGFSWYEKEPRFAEWRTAEKMLQGLEEGMKDAGLDYVDLWRISCYEQGGNHTFREAEEVAKALQAAKEQGKVRYTGVSSHDRRWLKMMIEQFPEVIQVVLTPYTARSKVLPQDSLFDTVKKHDVGVFGIKPFASNSLFKGDSTAASPDAEEDSKRARLAIRYILGNPAITAPIPGLISVPQVDNMAKAVAERRELDAKETAELEQATSEAWAKLPEDYHWLREWEYV